MSSKVTAQLVPTNLDGAASSSREDDNTLHSSNNELKRDRSNSSEESHPHQQQQQEELNLDSFLLNSPEYKRPRTELASMFSIRKGGWWNLGENNHDKSLLSPLIYSDSSLALQGAALGHSPFMMAPSLSNHQGVSSHMVQQISGEVVAAAKKVQNNAEISFLDQSRDTMLSLSGKPQGTAMFQASSSLKAQSPIEEDQKPASKQNVSSPTRRRNSNMNFVTALTFGGGAAVATPEQSRRSLASLQSAIASSSLPTPVAAVGTFPCHPLSYAVSQQYYEKQLLGVRSKEESNQLLLGDSNAESPLLSKAAVAAAEECAAASTELKFRAYQAENWSQRFTELIGYHRTHGHCLVPNSYTDIPQLAQWVKRQRYQFKLKTAGKRSTITDERIKALEEIGFVWDSHKAVWDERFQELLDYKAVHGDCNVRSRYKGNVPLAVWVKRQRRQYKFFSEGQPSSMTTERVARLQAVGFEWDLRKHR